MIIFLYCQNLNLARTLVIYDSSFAYLSKFVVVAIENNEQNATDLRSQLSKIKESNPDAIFTVQYETAVTNMLTQAESLNINVPILVPSILDEKMILTTGIASEGQYTSRALSTVSDPNYEAALKRISGMDSVDKDFKSPKAYDAMLLIKLAIEKADSFDNTVLKDTMLNMKFDGVGGSYEFDQYGTPAKANYVFQTVKEGKLVEVQ